MERKMVAFGPPLNDLEMKQLFWEGSKIHSRVFKACLSTCKSAPTNTALFSVKAKLQALRNYCVSVRTGLGYTSQTGDSYRSGGNLFCKHSLRELVHQQALTPMETVEITGIMRNLKVMFIYPPVSWSSAVTDIIPWDDAHSHKFWCQLS